MQGEENLHIMGEEWEDGQGIAKKFFFWLYTINFNLFSLSKKIWEIKKRKENCIKPYFPNYTL